jgi:ABC-type bacteriocin/lantibiotic exporter with double-glycine peptidase domain
MMALDRMATQALLRKLKEAPIGLERRREAQETPGSANGKGSSKAQARQNQLRTIPERLSDLYKANQTILSMWLKHGLDAGFSVLLMVVLFFLNVEMAVVSLLPLIPIAIEALWVAPKRRKSAAAAFKKNRETQLVLTEYLIQAETIQSLYAEEFWNRNVLQKINQTMRSGFGERFERTGAGNVQGFFGNLGSVLALFVGAHEVLEGKISFGAYLAISMLSRQVVAGCQKFLTASGEYQEATETVKVFRELAVEEETSRLQQGQTFYLEQANGELRLVNLHYRYDTDLPWVLSGLSCTVPAGLKIVLVGRSGSGKTTLIRLLQRFYQPSQGYICLDNINLLNLDLEGLRQCIGVVPQKPVLFSGTLYDNLVMGNPLANLGDILDVLKLVELDEEIMAHPKGLEAEVFPFGSNYSGGQAARLALARVLLKQPSVLVLDEALSQVEPALQVRIYQRILQLYHDKTVILVTDSLPIHQQVDAIVVMHEGRLVEAGTYRDLVQANGLYCKLFQPPPLVAATPSSSAPGASPA